MSKRGDIPNKPKLMLVISTTFAVHGFFEPHIKYLSQDFDIILVTNPSHQSLKRELLEHVNFVPVDVQRQISLVKDIIFFFQMFFLVARYRPNQTLTMTPKVGFIMGIVGIIMPIKKRTHIFAGQIWQTKVGLDRQFFKFLDWVLIRCLTNRLADSVSQVRFLEEEGVSKVGKIKTLGDGSICGVDTCRFRPDPSKYSAIRRANGLDKSDFIVLYLGRMVKDKGIFDALECLMIAHRKYKNIVFWTAGPDEEGLVDQLKNMARSSGIRFKYFGIVPSTVEFFQSADLFIMPSKREGFGSVLIEAAACGLPCLCYKTHGVVDAVEENVTGLLASYCDVEDLTKKLLSVFENPDHLKLMARNCRERAKKKFPEERLVKALREELS